MDLHSDHWWLEVFEALSQQQDVDELFARMRSFICELGFPFCSYGIRFPNSMVRPSIAVIDNYPDSWMKHYSERKYLSIDPTVQLGAQSHELIVWSDVVFARAPELWSDAQAVGLRVGVAQASWGSGGAYGLLSIAREAEPISESELSRIRPRLRWIMEIAHQKMQHFYAGMVATDLTQRLSRREHEIMQWTADGKTSWETAQILCISERTVNFHIQNVLSKLNAQNKIQAAVKAASLGMLSAGHTEAPSCEVAREPGELVLLPGVRDWYD